MVNLPVPIHSTIQKTPDHPLAHGFHQDMNSRRGCGHEELLELQRLKQQHTRQCNRVWDGGCSCAGSRKDGRELTNITAKNQYNWGGDLHSRSQSPNHIHTKVKFERLHHKAFINHHHGQKAEPFAYGPRPQKTIDCVVHSLCVDICCR